MLHCSEQLGTSHEVLLRRTSREGILVIVTQIIDTSAAYGVLLISAEIIYRYSV
jgi:hypothetical protein